MLEQVFEISIARNLWRDEWVAHITYRPTGVCVSEPVAKTLDELLGIIESICHEVA